MPEAAYKSYEESQRRITALTLAVKYVEERGGKTEYAVEVAEAFEKFLRGEGK